MSSQPVAAERQRDAERTKAEILAIARREFARHGYTGTRVDEIAALTRTTKRMIYYYFGSKENLYIKVLEQAYAEVRAAESAIDVEHLAPVEAIRTLAELTFDHHDQHEDFIRLVSFENIQRAEHLRKSPVLLSLGNPVIELIRRILEAGQENGDFITPVDAVDVHMIISSFCFFRVANRHTWSTLTGRDPDASDLRPRHRQMIGDLVVAYLTSSGQDRNSPR